MTGGACDLRAAIVFVIGLLAGTGCIICSKALFEIEAVGLSGELEMFRPPVFQTWVMFAGMVFALPAYSLSECHRSHKAKTDAALRRKMEAEPPITLRTLLVLAVPAIFDLSSVVLMVIGLMHVNASVWMLLRGGGIVFVALMKQYALGDRLTAQMWSGVGIISLAVLLVGSSSLLDESSAAAGADVPFGVAITLVGTFMQSLQYVYEERVMSGSMKAPPWLLIGMEGLFGTLLCSCAVYPLAGLIPGADHGKLEDIDNTIEMLTNSAVLRQLSITFCILVFILNSFSVLVTFMLSSVWHSILDNFRPVSIWLVELLLNYVITDGEHGEPWTRGSFLQLGGLAVMLFGTAVYNGSVSLPGVPTKPLLASASRMSSPALSRSPLVIMNTADAPFTSLFGDNPPTTMHCSPYANYRPADPPADPMLERGGRSTNYAHLLAVDWK